ncbi:MAG: ABC transporter ATP-binding protein [Acetobacteraceae bacterium]
MTATAPLQASRAASPDQTAVRFQGVTVSFGTFTAIKGVDLSVDPGEFLCVVGPSGCGKSTILNVITGLLTPSAGTVAVYGQTLRGMNRDVGYMLQQDGLLPWRTALDNIALGPLFKGAQVAQAREQARPWLDKIGMAGAGGRYPWQLSGGMRKRVGLAQTLIMQPKILLMDEPFSALDIHTRHMMENELLSLWAEAHSTVVFITHDLEEAISLGDRVVVMSAGPASRPIATFPIDLPRPRDVAEIRLTEPFLRTHRAIWDVLREEVLRSHAPAVA